MSNAPGEGLVDRWAEHEGGMPVRSVRKLRPGLAPRHPDFALPRAKAQASTPRSQIQSAPVVNGWLPYKLKFQHPSSTASPCYIPVKGVVRASSGWGSPRYRSLPLPQQPSSRALPRLDHLRANSWNPMRFRRSAAVTACPGQCAFSAKRLNPFERRRSTIQRPPARMCPKGLTPRAPVADHPDPSRPHPDFLGLHHP